VKIPISIHLSVEAVHVGIAEITKNGEIPSQQEDSYMKGFFCEDIKKARVKVEDGRLSTPWTFDTKFTKLVTDLVNEPAEMKGHDIEVTQLKSTFQVDMRNGNKLITRSLSRGVVADCFRELIFEDSRAITGNPGIGKSWTLIYALQQALLYENSCVIFCFQKRSAAWVCIRKNNHIYVWCKNDPSLKTNCDSRLFDNSKVLVLLDPREATQGGASYVEGARRLIFAASNDEQHFSANPGKITGDYQKILNPYSLNELKVALPYIIDEFMPKEDRLPLNKMLRCTKEVGNLPRYLVSQEKFEDRIKCRDSFINYFSNKNADIGAVLTWNGMTEISKTDPGTVFSVSVKETCLLQGPPMDVGYDGENVTIYEEIGISLMVPKMEDKLLTKWRTALLHYFGKIQGFDAIVIGFGIENLFWKDLRDNQTMVHKKMGVKGAKMTTISFGYSEHLGNVVMKDLKADIFDSDTKRVGRMRLNSPLIVFAGTGRQVYQMTVSLKHDILADHMCDILLACGLLQLSDDGAISMTHIEINRLTFYWVVPSEIGNKWANKNPKGITITGTLKLPKAKKDQGVVKKEMPAEEKKKSTANLIVLKTCILSYVDQYVLNMMEP
jgi:hypothetical protein